MIRRVGVVLLTGSGGGYKRDVGRGSVAAARGEEAQAEKLKKAVWRFSPAGCGGARARGEKRG